MTELDIIPAGQTESISITYTMDRGSHGRINSVTYPDGLQDFNNFNSWGYLTNRIDRACRNYDFTYAYPTDLLKSQTQYLEDNGSTIPVTTKFDYDEHFNSLRITEPRNRYVETYLFDIQSRIIGVTNIEGQVMSVDYGLLNMVKEIDRFDGSKVTYGFDQYARQNKMTISSAVTNYVVEAEYNTDNTLKNIKDGNSRADLSYNIRNEVIAASSSNVVETAYSYKYDGIGNVTNYVLVTDAYTSTNNYAFDAGNRLTNMVLTAWERQAPAWQNITYSYNPTNGLASSWTNSASGIFCSYEYDIMDRPVSLEWKAGDGSTIKSYDYMYSNADMITNIVDNLGNVTKYEFDTLDRLTKEINGDNITAYKYDLAGNRLQMRKIENAQVTNEVDYTLGLGNRLASWGDNGEAHYDLAGCLTNMVSDIDNRELNLGWNSKYQLISVDSVDSNEVGGKVSYDYNVLGQRVSRTETVAGVITTEYYVHDGVNIVADLDEDKELLRSYSYASGYDNIISMTSYGDSETNTYFYIRNHNNSVVALVDEDGNVAESYEYDAYGEVTVFDGNGNELDESALGNRYCFQGREIDYTTGLYNFRARWYDSETGRWLSKDPIGIQGGLNQYVFCNNNPVMFVDPEGNRYNISGYGTLIGSEVSCYGVLGGVIGTQTVTYDSGEVVTYGYFGFGVGAGNLGGRVYKGNVNNIRDPKDYAGGFIDLTYQLGDISNGISTGIFGDEGLAYTYGLTGTDDWGGIALSVQYFVLLSSSDDPSISSQINDIIDDIKGDINDITSPYDSDEEKIRAMINFGRW